MSKTRLLIVDDDEDIRTQMKWALCNTYDLLTAGDRASALDAVGAGAYDFLCKPVDMDELRLVLQRCVYLAELEQEYRAMQSSARADAFDGMLGGSPPMQSVFDLIRKVAPTGAPVLILG